jgi:restriction modification system DNA specificity domain protein
MLCLEVDNMARQMKDSGIEWIGEIPENWEVIPLKYLASYNDETLSEATEYEYEFDYVEIGSVEYGKGITQTEHLMFKNAPSRARRIVRKDDIIVSTVRTYLKAVARVESKEQIASTGFVVIRPKNVDAIFLQYGILAQSFISMVEAYSTGISYPAINASQVVKFKLPVPNANDQRHIAKYLDQQCAHIDSVIEKTKASIEEYKKLKQAVIAPAVTKGIRGNRPMKDSGIEWIGEVPVEWELKPFRRVLKERNEKNSPVKSEERLSLSIELGVTLYSEKTTNLDRFKDDFEQYKLAHEGDLVMNSMNMIVGASGVSNYYGCVSPVYYTYYDEEDDHITAKYCEYIFRSKTMLRVLFSLGKGIYAIVRGDDRVNTCRLKVAKEDLKSLIIPVPSTEEQREIVKYLNEKSKDIEEVIKKKEEFLEELEYYKKSLIYEYVTGKKEVPQSCQ